MKNRLFSPGKLFAGLIFRPAGTFQNLEWRTAVRLMIIMTLITVAFCTTVVGLKLSPEAILEQPEMKSMIEEGLLQEEDLEIFSSPSYLARTVTFSALGSLLTFGAGWMIKSSLLLGAISLAGGKLSWKESTAVVGASWVTFLFYHLLQGVVTLQGWQIAPLNGFGAILATHLNIFVLWNLVLLTIGFAAVAGISRRRAFACSAGYQALVILLAWGYSKLFGALGANMF